MAKDVISIQLEWTYSPATYLEESISLEIDGCSIKIDNGKAMATLEPSFFEENKDIRDALTHKIENYFFAVQLFTHAGFNLNEPVRTDILNNGKRTIYLEFHDSISISSSISADLIIKDLSDNVVLDTKQERLNKQRWFAGTINRFRATDITLAHMLQSYQKSVDDPDNELVHLYEIRDALNQHFGSKKKAIKQLQIKESTWDEIGKLANALPLKQGRHRGSSVGQLREATQTELREARTAARNLIESYLQSLEKSLNS